VLQCVGICHRMVHTARVLQSVAVCCPVLQRVLQCVQCVGMCHKIVHAACVLQSIAVCCSVLQCVLIFVIKWSTRPVCEECCSVLQNVFHCVVVCWYVS